MRKPILFRWLIAICGLWPNYFLNAQPTTGSQKLVAFGKQKNECWHNRPTKICNGDWLVRTTGADDVKMCMALPAIQILSMQSMQQV